jgi:multidrug resistance efflux pump
MMSIKFRQTNNLNYYNLLWFIALIIVIGLASQWVFDKKFVAIVESKSHWLSAQESGRIDNLLVTVGNEVKKDQVLAVLDISDLKITIDRLKEELNRFQGYKKAQQNRHSILVHRMALQLENEALDLIGWFSGLEEKTSELESLNAEIERLESAEKAGLGQSRELVDLKLKRDALTGYLKEQGSELLSQKQKLENVRSSRRMFSESEIDSMSESLFFEEMGYAGSLYRQVTELEHRIGMRSVIAPCDGQITQLLAQTGDVVDAFAPVMTIEESRPIYLEVYIPEHSRVSIEPRMKVKVYSTRSRRYNTTGTVIFVHPGISGVSERMSFRGQNFWARKVRVELEPDHLLIPGEMVHVRIQRKKQGQALSLVASELNTPERAAPNSKKPREMSMQIPDKLLKKTRFEPSGVVWLSDSSQFLIVSDDTGLPDESNDHAPYVFLMNEYGMVNPDPVSLKGIDTVNDLESITPVENNTFLLISSQNISKQNRRPGNRELILKVERNGDLYTVREEVRLLSLLLRSYTWQELKNLGLDQYEADGLPVLNIEGAAVKDQTLYLGLKEPISQQGAIIWKLDSYEDIFRIKKLAPNQLTVYGFVQLARNEPTGFSDLMFDSNGILWALSATVGNDRDRTGGLHRIDRFEDGHLEATRIFNFPGFKPEGFCPNGAGGFLIVFDQDNDTPLFCSVNMGGS